MIRLAWQRCHMQAAFWLLQFRGRGDDKRRTNNNCDTNSDWRHICGWNRCRDRERNKTTIKHQKTNGNPPKPGYKPWPDNWTVEACWRQPKLQPIELSWVSYISPASVISNHQCFGFVLFSLRLPLFHTNTTDVCIKSFFWGWSSEACCCGSSWRGRGGWSSFKVQTWPTCFRTLLQSCHFSSSCGFFVPPPKNFLAKVCSCCHK